MLTRRTLLAAGLSAALGTLARHTQATAEEPSGAFLDIHTHVGQIWNTTKYLSPVELLKWMDERDVAQAVVLPLVSPESASFPLSTEFVLEQVRPHRDRLIPFCCIDPRTSHSGGREGALDMLKRYVDAGCRGFGEYKPGTAIDDPRSMRLYNLCGEVGLPVLFHLDGERNTDKPGLPGLEAVLKTHPKTQFIGHGPGFWASISEVKTPAELAGYPKGPVLPGGALDRLMEAYPNLFGDLSAGSGATALQRDLKFAAGFFERRQNRLLFGTDYLSPGQPVAQFDVLKQIDVDDSIRRKIYRDNARILLRLKS